MWDFPACHVWWHLLRQVSARQLPQIALCLAAWTSHGDATDTNGSYILHMINGQMENVWTWLEHAWKLRFRIYMSWWSLMSLIYQLMITDILMVWDVGWTTDSDMTMVVDIGDILVQGCAFQEMYLDSTSEITLGTPKFTQETYHNSYIYLEYDSCISHIEASP